MALFRLFKYFSFARNVAMSLPLLWREWRDRAEAFPLQFRMATGAAQVEATVPACFWLSVASLSEDGRNDNIYLRSHPAPTRQDEQQEQLKCYERIRLRVGDMEYAVRRTAGHVSVTFTDGAVVVGGNGEMVEPGLLQVLGRIEQLQPVWAATDQQYGFGTITGQLSNGYRVHVSSAYSSTIEINLVDERGQLILWLEYYDKSEFAEIPVDKRTPYDRKRCDGDTFVYLKKWLEERFAATKARDKREYDARRAAEERSRKDGVRRFYNP